jgi:hypothetical protein
MTDRNNPFSVDNLDLTVPSPARIYDYFLGGKDNFPADREAAEKALSVVPHGREVAQANRQFLIGAVRLMASRGIRQFIDLGTGIPTSPNVHEVARSIHPDAKVLYVDNDPVVCLHASTLLTNVGDGVASIMGDIRSPQDLVAKRELRDLIDFTAPVGVLFVAVLHFLTSTDDPLSSVTVLADRMAADSYLAISHITSDGTAPAVMNTIESAYGSASAPAVFRTTNEIRALFAGLELVKPGLVDVSAWRGHGRIADVEPFALRFLGGVAKKTEPSLPGAWPLQRHDSLVEQSL